MTKYQSKDGKTTAFANDGAVHIHTVDNEGISFRSLPKIKEEERVTIKYKNGIAETKPVKSFDIKEIVSGDSKIVFGEEGIRIITGVYQEDIPKEITLNMGNKTYKAFVEDKY